MRDGHDAERRLDGPSRAGARSMLRPVGFTDEDFKKPVVGIASLWSMVTPCNMHIDKLAVEAEAGTNAAGGKGVIFGTITVSDGISMGTQGMRYSLVSREVIADSIEAVAGGEGFDGLVTIGGCDKNMPGCIMAMARLNRPGVFVYGGTILPGIHPDSKKECDIVSVYEAIGQHAAGKVDDAGLRKIEACSIPGPGSCGGMYTANTMASAIEALGMSLLGSSQMASPDGEKADSAALSAKVLVNAIRHGIRPRDIITRKSIENAVSLIMATGGSTNAVLHYLAIAHAAEVKWTIDDFERMRKKVPVLCDLKPSGRYVAVDFHRAGGVPQVLKMLLKHGLLHGDCMTITGETMAQALAKVPDNPRKNQDVIRQWDNPMYKQGHLAILKGNPKNVSTLLWFHIKDIALVGTPIPVRTS